MKNIFEQSTGSGKGAINAPKDEIDKLMNNTVISNKGQLQLLCDSDADGYPNPVAPFDEKTKTFYNRVYTAAIVTPKNFYFTYDGLVLKGDRCKPTIVYKGDRPERLFAQTELTHAYDELLNQFNIPTNNPRYNVYTRVPGITKELQIKFINKGGVSDLFNEWNKMLSHYFPATYTELSLKPINGKSLDIPLSASYLRTNYVLVDNAEDYGIKYKSEQFPIYMPRGAQYVTSDVNEITVDEKQCINKLKEYLHLAFRAQHGEMKDISIEDMKQDAFERAGELQSCKTNNGYVNFKGFGETYVDENGRPVKFMNVEKEKSYFGPLRKKINFNRIERILNGETKEITFLNPYLMSFERGTNESISYGLKNVIKENLINAKKKKNTNLQLESKIIKNRLNIISESSSNKTKKQIETFNNNLISEIMYFNKQGFDRKLISENVWEMLKGFFGTGFEAGIQTFKEYLASFLVNTLTPFDSESWIGGTIVKALGDVPIGDYFNGKILECDYITKVLAKAILEEGLDKMLENIGLEGTMYDVLRNALANLGEDTTVGQKLEKGLASMVCSKMKGVKSKMDNLGNTLKSKAFAD